MTSLYIRSLLVAVIAWTCVGSVQAANESVKFFGDYSHVESSTGEHCDGYSVTLWKHKDSLIGFIDHHRGLCGDPPTGILEEVSYTASTGSLSFTAKLSDGCIFIQKSRQCVPTKDIVKFKGTLQRQVLEGMISWYRADTLQQYHSEKLILKAKDLGTSPHESYDTHDKWRVDYEPILKRRALNQRMSML